MNASAYSSRKYFSINRRHSSFPIFFSRGSHTFYRCCFVSDVVGFTTIASTISPAKVSDMLDRLYRRFDELTFKYKVFKIETVGDAYLCVTNLIEDQEFDHAKRIAEFSAAAIQAANETYIDLENPNMGCVQIRVGFHSGPVITNVVGCRLPKFSMFGDTINCAARMESNSLPGRIHCSKESADLLMTQHPNDVILKSRGQIEIKGKGLMETFWVEFDGANDHSSNDEQPPIKSLLPKVSLAPTERTSVGSIISSYCGEDFHDGDDESCGTLISC